MSNTHVVLEKRSNAAITGRETSTSCDKFSITSKLIPLRSNRLLGSVIDVSIQAAPHFFALLLCIHLHCVAKAKRPTHIRPDLARNEWANQAEQPNGSDDDRDGFVDDLHGWDFVTDTGEVRDLQGHGTAMAGIIASEGNNALGTAGVMWRASLMSLRVLDQTGTGDVASAVEAMDYAVAHGAQVVNCSWSSDGASRALLDAIKRANQTPPVSSCHSPS